MDHGPETKKQRLSTAGSSWASSSGHSPANTIPSSSSSHLYQSHPHHQQQSYYPAASAHNHNPSNPDTYPGAAPHHQQYHQPHQQPPPPHQQQVHGRSPRLPSPRINSPRLHSPRHSPHYTLQQQQQQPYPSHSSAGPYQTQTAHPSSAPSPSANGPVTSTAAALDQRPPLASSPAPPTPVSAHSFTNTTTLPPPPGAPHNGVNTNGRPSQHKPSHSHSHSQSHPLSQPRTYQPHLDDRRHHEQDPYALGQDHRQQDYHSQQQQQQQHQQQHQPPDYRFPSRSPAGAAPGLPPPPHNATPYDRADKLQHPQPVDDDPSRIRPGSAASATGVRSQQQQQQQNQMPPMRHPEDGSRSMSFDNHAQPNMGGPGQPPHPYGPYPGQQQPPPPHQQQQPPQMHHLPSQHQQHPPPPQHPQQPYSQPPPPQQPPHHQHGHMQAAGPPQQPQPTVVPPQAAPQGPNPPYRQPSYPSTSTPTTMGHPQPPLPPQMPMQQHPHAQPLQPQQPSPTQPPPQLQPHPSQQQQPSPQQQQPMPQPPPPPPPQQPPQLQPHYEQPPPSQQQTPMFNHASVPPQSADILYPLAYAAAGKKKAQRASQACDSCRSLKAKCDETKPCKNCREKNIECKYRDPVPKQQDRVATDLLESVGTLRQDMVALRKDVMNTIQQGFKSVMEMVQTTATQAAVAAVAGNPGAGLAAHGGALASSSDAMDIVPGSSDVGVAATPFAAALPAEVVPLSSDEAERITREAQGELNTVEDFTGPAVKPNESAIPSNHTTLAGLLLTWPTIRERVHHLLKEQGIDHPTEYPLRQEEQRGTIRMHGRGEGRDERMTARAAEHNSVGGSSQPGTSVPMERGTSTNSNNSSGGNSYDDGNDSRYPGEIWGQLGGWGSLGAYPSTELDFDNNTVWKYVRSYEEHIQIMHPIINPRPLRAIVTLFLDTLPRTYGLSQTSRSTWSAPSNRAPVAAFAGTPDLFQAQSPTAEGSLKRKRSPFPEGYSGPSATGSTPVAPTMPLRPNVPFRNLDSALVLGIMALGKICLYKHGRLPDVVPENLDPESPPPTGSQSSQPSPVFADASIHANNGYSPAPSIHDSPSASPAIGLGNTPSRRTSMQGGGGHGWANAPPAPVTNTGNFMPPSSSGAGSAKGGNGGVGPSTMTRRNIDEIPGLDYFSACLEILTSYSGSRELKLVWVYIIACLYYGQIGRPIQSLDMITAGGRALLQIMRPSMHRYNKIQTELQENSLKRDAFGNIVKTPEEKNVQHRDNPYLLAYWSCLQLESDILAELHLPPSGILTYEKLFPYPRIDLLTKHGIDQAILESYTAQLYLRNQLNDIHKTLYHGDFNGQPNFKSIEMYSGLLSTHTWVPPRYAFNDTDPPPNTILHARLRAKYWGAQVIVHRFYVRRILEINYEKRKRLEDRRRKLLEAPSGGSTKEETEDEDTKTAAGSESQSAVDFSDVEIPVGGLESGPDVRPENDDSPFSRKSISLARRGIQALIESTRAFHGLPDRRFIITNVFGTAHAQWGNLLILDSIQRDPVLGRYISEELVNDLFRKTIAFFEVVSQPTSSLGYDLRILKGLYAMRLANPVSIEQAKDLPVTQGLPSGEEMNKMLTSMDPQQTVLSANMAQMQELYPYDPFAPTTVATDVAMDNTTPVSVPAPNPVQAQTPSQPHHQPLPPSRVSPLAPPPLPVSNPAASASASVSTSSGGAAPHPPYPPLFNEGSPMNMSPMASSPVQHTSPGTGTMPSPSQARLPGMQYGPSSTVKTPTTPNEPGFPHHLPHIDQRR